ncbi:hypothetical protein [Mesorhizobium sp.]|uniref:DUF6894 family protein n=1 Tax=Mesorhizobium sp. TaxID=1871066 RepID=UPI00257F9BAC|nr:hypothetical protein [Mesorhizobium sp.]
MAALSLNYFDVRNNDRLFSDTEGTWLAGGMDSVRLEAFAALTDYAREVTPSVICRRLTVKARDEDSKPLLEAVMDVVIGVVCLRRPRTAKALKKRRAPARMPSGEPICGAD